MASVVIQLYLWGIDMSKLVIHFDNDDAREDFTDWLSDNGQGEFDDYLHDRKLTELNLNFIDEENIEIK